MQEHTVMTSQPGTGRASSAGSRGLRRTFQVAAALAFAVFSLANLATTGCDTCKGDVLIFALNRLSPHYVSTRQGEVLTELSLGSDQERAEQRTIGKVKRPHHFPDR